MSIRLTQKKKKRGQCTSPKNPNAASGARKKKEHGSARVHKRVETIASMTTNHSQKKCFLGRKKHVPPSWGRKPEGPLPPIAET